MSTDNELKVPGGCDDCDAYQVIDRTLAPVYMVTVHHDETCPRLRAAQPKEKS